MRARAKSRASIVGKQSLRKTLSRNVNIEAKLYLYNETDESMRFSFDPRWSKVTMGGARLVSYNRQFDERALQRWVDDGGRWLDATLITHSMGTGMNEEATRQPLRPGAGAMLSLKISDEVARLKAKPEWAAQDRVAASLVKDDALNVMLMVLKEDARLAEHRTKGPIALNVLSGSVRFYAEGESKLLSAGEVVALDRDVSHSLESLEESVLLFTTSIS